MHCFLVLFQTPGIPKFYRWLSERYPLVNKTISSSEGPPVVDALYLDMNGIIHNCTHANQQEIKLTKDEMIVRMFDYISKLVQIIKPQKLLFMAIDGGLRWAARADPGRLWCQAVQHHVRLHSRRLCTACTYILTFPCDHATAPIHCSWCHRIERE